MKQEKKDIIRVYTIAKNLKKLCEENDDLFCDFVHLEIIDDMKEIMEKMESLFRRYIMKTKHEQKS